jgi:hypothetical protein
VPLGNTPEGLSRGAAEDHVAASRLHGLQPWLGSDAAPRRSCPIEVRGLMTQSSETTPNFLARLDDLSDWISPIVVKEVRQIVRGREFNYSFGISLAIGLVAAFWAGTAALNGSPGQGAWIFSTLVTCLALIGLLIVPMGAFSALRNERGERTLDLVTLTSLSPRRLVIGKVLAQGVKLVTLFAGLAPFIVMSFLLGGIDLVTILISLALLFLWSLWACAGCLFLSCLSRSRAISGGLIGILTIVFFFLMTVGRALYFTAMYRGGGFAGIFLPAGAFGPTRSNLWWALASMTAICLTTMTNLVLLAENRISPPTQNRVTALRLGFFVQFVVILAVFIGSLTSLPSGAATTNLLQMMCAFAGLQLAVVATFTVTEDLALRPQMLLQLKSSALWRWRTVIFRPGGGAGALYVLAQMFMLVIAGWRLMSSPDQVRWLVAICGYICFLTGVPICLGRMFAPRVTTAYLRVAVLLFFAGVMLFADLLYYVLNPSYAVDGYSFFHILNPVRTLSNWDLVEANHWQNFVFGLGLLGLLSYLKLIQMNQRLLVATTDENAAH